MGGGRISAEKVGWAGLWGHQGTGTLWLTAPAVHCRVIQLRPLYGSHLGLHQIIGCRGALDLQDPPGWSGHWAKGPPGHHWMWIAEHKQLFSVNILLTIWPPLGGAHTSLVKLLLTGVLGIGICWYGKFGVSKLHVIPCALFRGFQGYILCSNPPIWSTASGVACAKCPLPVSRLV